MKGIRSIRDSPNTMSLVPTYVLTSAPTARVRSKANSKPPVVESQNPHLRQLNSILKSREAVAALRDNASIEAAFELSRTPTAVFEEALLRAKRELQRAKAHVATGYDCSEGLLRTAGTVATMADSIYNEMDRMRNPDKKARITEGFGRWRVWKLEQPLSPP